MFALFHLLVPVHLFWNLSHGGTRKEVSSTRLQVLLLNGNAKRVSRVESSCIRGSTLRNSFRGCLAAVLWPAASVELSVPFLTWCLPCGFPCSERGRERGEGGRVAADLLCLRLRHSIRSHHGAGWREQHRIQREQEIHGQHSSQFHHCSHCRFCWKRRRHSSWRAGEPHRSDRVPLLIWVLSSS